MGKNVLALKASQRPKEAGKYYRLVGLSGDQQGKVYLIQGKRVVMGRGDDCDIQILDAKASREHAEIINFGDNFVITDLGSQNGILVNDTKVKQHNLEVEDKILVGSTVFKFDSLVVEDKKDPVKATGKKETKEENQKEAEEIQKEVESKRKKNLLLIVLALVAYVLLSGDENTPEKRRARKRAAPKDITDEFTASLQKKQYLENKELEQKLNVIFARGLREYREGNYYRAMSEFNLALILSPNNGRASFYLEKTKQGLDTEIKTFFNSARLDVEALKYQDALAKYCSILRLIQSNPEDTRYKDAEANIKEVEKLMGREEGETKCTPE